MSDTAVMEPQTATNEASAAGATGLAGEAHAPTAADNTQARAAQMLSFFNQMPRLPRIFNSVAQLRMPERVLLYAIVYGEKPRNMLEIGTCEGGSALIFTGAMDDYGFGKLVCVDSKFQIRDEDWRMIKHRTTLVEGFTPEVFAKVRATSDEAFDFAFIDGDHSTDGVFRDVEGTLPMLANRATLLFHDSHFADVKAGIERALRAHSDELHDCGELSIEQTPIEVPGWGTNVWGGVRMVRFRRAHSRV